MTVTEIVNKLEAMGTEQTKKTLMRHGACEPLFGVKVGDMKKLVKEVKKDQELALALYDTGIYDAMYLAGLSVKPKLMTKEQLQHWISQVRWHAPAEYTVASVAAESPYALELAREWIQSEDEIKAICGWSTYSNYLSITSDADLDLDEIRLLLDQVERTIHQERNRVRYTMNGFVISVGTYVTALHDKAKAVAETIGKVHVDVGDTACKVPMASDYIHKVESMNRVGQKRKTCIC